MRKVLVSIAAAALLSLTGCEALVGSLLGFVLEADTGFFNHSSHVITVQARCSSSSRDYDQFRLNPGDSHTFTHPSEWVGNSYYDDVAFEFAPTDTVICTSSGYEEKNITFVDR